MKENKIEKHWLGRISYSEGLEIQNNKVQLNKLKDKISNGPYKDYLIKILKK